MTGLRWGILATGGIARSFTSDLRTAGLTVSAVGSRRPEAAAGFAQAFDIPRAHGSYADLFDDPEVDIVYIATPNPLHAPNALAALEAGKHVLIEKPFALNAAQAEAVRRSAVEKGLLAMEAMWTRYLPHMVRMREILAAGTIGEVRAVHADHAQSLSTDPTHRINAPALGGGALLDLGVYPISFACDVLGVPRSVLAQARLSELGTDTEVGTVFSHFSGAVSTTLSSSRARGANTAHVIGTEGRIDIDPVWFKPASFRVTGRDGDLLETFDGSTEGRGMQFQARYTEQLVASGLRDSDILPLTESVAIMATLDEIRRQIGVRYPEEA